jgi:hypothetical protein
VGGVLIAALKLIEYRSLVLEHSVEIYGALIALVFSGLGIWLGLKLTRRAAWDHRAGTRDPRGGRGGTQHA